jgi:hypothetical protein
VTLTIKVLALASAAMLTASAQAQFVNGNEAITIKADGVRTVHTPPLPSIKLGPPCHADNAGCWSGPVLMIETAAGLQECTEFYARPGTCRASTYGTVKRARLWVIRVKGQWVQCPRPDAGSGCVSTKALPPVAAVQ